MTRGGVRTHENFFLEDNDPEAPGGWLGTRNGEQRRIFSGIAPAADKYTWNA